MAENLGRLKVARKTGAERFQDEGEDLGTDLLDFWQWSMSDLVSNVTRGRLAEYVVARALNINTSGVRDEWAAYDLETHSGVKVEVKSASFNQSWHQAKFSAITFTIPATRAWDPRTNTQSPEARRQADIYIFALLHHTDKPTIDPLNVRQWRFYVLPTFELNARTRSQHSITLKSLEKLCGEGVTFWQLAGTAEAAIARSMRPL